MFACCQNEWCLLGDLLYDAPPPAAQHQQDWDPWETEQEGESNKPGRERTKSSDGEASRRTLHHGYKGIVETQVGQAEGCRGCRRVDPCGSGS